MKDGGRYAITAYSIVPPSKDCGTDIAGLVRKAYGGLGEIERPDAVLFGACPLYADWKGGASALREMAGKAPAFWQTYTSTGLTIVGRALDMLRKGEAGRVLVLTAQKMSGQKSVEDRISAFQIPLDYAAGTRMNDFGAIAGKAYLEATGAPRKALAEVVGKNYVNASRNPRAQIRNNTFTEDTYLGLLERGEHVVAETGNFRLLREDCSPVSDGAAALVIEKAGRALPGQIEMIGYGEGIDGRTIGDRSASDILEQKATAEAGGKAFRMAGESLGLSGFDASEIDVASLHGAYSPLELISMEALGMSEPGNAWKDLMAGKTMMDGLVPVNASGGLLKQGHPLAASGMIQLIETIKQLRGEDQYARRISRNADFGLVESIGRAANHNAVLILRAR